MVVLRASVRKPSVSDAEDAVDACTDRSLRHPAMSSLFGIPLALLCALTTNVGFLYKYRGARAAPPVSIRRPLRSAKALSNRLGYTACSD